MSIGRRLEKLEEVQGARVCRCLNPFEVRYYLSPTSKADADSDTTPASACQACGEPRTLLKGIYSDNWNRGGA
jgi:hypothetical protein